MPRIALIYDKPGWAFHNIALDMQKYSCKGWEFSLFPNPERECVKNFGRRIQSEFDLIHFFVRQNPTLDIGIPSTTSVHSRNGLRQSILVKNSLRSREFFVTSPTLLNEYTSLYPSRIIHYCPEGVNTSLFYPRVKEAKRRISVGWVGNPDWGFDDHKGYNGILIPLIREVDRLKLPIDFKIAGSATNKLSRGGMPAFYNSLDILLCTSKSEGAPLPILEASACGIMWISTDVGIVKVLSGSIQSEFIVERSVESFLVALLQVTSNPDLITQCGLENYQRIQNGWTLQQSNSSKVNFFKHAIGISHE